MIVQIYTTQSVEEALALKDAGVDHIGITPSTIGLPGEVDYGKAAEIFRALEGEAVRVALSVETEPKEIIRMVSEVKPDILHLCGPSRTRLMPPKLYLLRRALPGVRIMQAVSVGGPESVPLALSYQDAADILILDTEVSRIQGVGASGETHDWSVSREIVRRSRIPVIMAGGLSPDNLAEAIETVQPWGVDSLTHTNRHLNDGKFEKDLDLVRRFVEKAHSTSL